MDRGDARTAERVRVVGRLLGHAGEYGVVTALSRTIGVTRPTMYAWRAKGERAVAAVFAHGTVSLRLPAAGVSALAPVATPELTQRFLTTLHPEDSLCQASGCLLLGEVQARGLRWAGTVSDGGLAMQQACASVDPDGHHQRALAPAGGPWHVLHICGQVQGRLDRCVRSLETQTATVWLFALGYLPARQVRQISMPAPPDDARTEAT